MRVHHCWVRVCVLALSTACWCWCLSAAEKGSKKDGREGEVQWEEIEEKSNGREGGESKLGEKGRRVVLYLQSLLPQPRGSDTAAAASAFPSRSNSHMELNLSPQQHLPAATMD